MGQVKSVSEINCYNKRVLVRVDFNVPMKDGLISDDTRIRAALPTIHSLITQKAKAIILISHLGRPEGKNASLSLAPIAARLSQLLGQRVIFLSDCIGIDVERSISEESEKTLGTIYLLENVRFYPAEENPQDDPTFVEKLARLGDVYVNDAFGTAHRAHSSTALIAKFFPQQRAAGLLMMKEIRALGTHLQHPERPFTAIIGGAKISTKLGILKSLIQKVDTLLIGGGMSYTFLKAQGVAIGRSISEPNMISEAQRVLELAAQKNTTIMLPRDVVVATALSETAPRRLISLSFEGIPSDYEGVDIGPETIAAWSPYLEQSRTIFWNGPLGVFEIDAFAQGTFTIAQKLAQLQGKTFTVVGGGDSVSALEKLHLQDAISHVSTGGGASLEFIEQAQLPGIQALEE